MSREHRRQQQQQQQLQQQQQQQQLLLSQQQQRFDLAPPLSMGPMGVDGEEGEDEIKGLGRVREITGCVARTH